MTNQSFPEDRRKHSRIQKNFILSYYDKTTPESKHDATQLKNISLGGICFVTSYYYAPGTTIGIDLKTPYLANTITLEGRVLECTEKVKNIIYQTRLEFNSLSPQAQAVITKVVEYFTSSRS